MRFSVSGALLVALLLALPLCAQIDNGNITGRVTDPSGAVVAGAQVTVVQTEMNFETVTTTNEEGLYRTLNLRPGPYRITIVAQGFKKTVREGIELSVGQTLSVNQALEVGAVAESVEVKANAQQLETETSSSGAVVAGDYFYSIPNYQRNVKAVLLYTPGVTFSTLAYTGRFDNMQIDGLSNSTIGYFEDGAIGTVGGSGSGNATDTILNTVEDIKVLTTALPAEYGHTTGGVITVVKKSGTNQLHGIMSEQIRTRMMQQRKFFDMYRNSQVQPGWAKPPGLIVQNPDANISGPVYIPKIYDGRNKTFFLFAWSGLAEKQSKQAISTVPTAAMLNGDFNFPGVTPNPIYDPVATTCSPASACQAPFTGVTWARALFPNNQVPRNRWSKVATTILGMNPYRLPNVVGSMGNGGPSNNMLIGPMKVVVWDNWSIRLDQQFKPSLKAYATWTYNSRWERQPPYTIANSFFDNTLNKNISPKQNTASAGITWIPTPTMVNDLRGSYYENANIVSSIAYNQDYAKQLGMSGLPATCMPGIWPGGFTESIQVNCPSRNVQEILTLKDDLSKAWGKHSFKMGYELLRFRQNQWDMQTPDGSFSYAGTGGLQANGSGISNTGNTLAGFMVGAMSGFNFGTRLQSNLPRMWQHSFYLQDDWKVTPTLTLNLGMRYNLETPAKQKYGFISIWDMTVPDNATYSNTAYSCPPPGCMGSFTHPKGADPYPMKFDKWDPRFGLAWHMMNRLVFRGGFNLSHSDWRLSYLYTDEMMTNAISVGTPSGEHRPLFMLDNGIPAWSYPALRADGSVPLVTTNFGARGGNILQSNLRTPYYMTWNLGFQFELSKDYLLELQYNGAAQAQTTNSYDLNTRPWGIIPNPSGNGFMNLEDPANAAYRLTWATGGQTQYSRPWINLGGVNMQGNDGHLSHNAGMVRIEKRYSKGLNFQAFYTYQKTLSAGAGNQYLNWGLFKARTGTDQTHNFTSTMNYEIPVGKGRRFLNQGGWLDRVVGGWNFVWTYTIASGGGAGMSISGQPTTNNYPGYMPTYGGVILMKRPSLRNNWQDLGNDRFTQNNQNSMINCGAVVIAWGNDCFTYVPSFSRGNNGNNLWNNQRQIAASTSLSKEVAIRERFHTQIRLDFQNPFKWYNWGGTNTGLNVQSIANSKSFGTESIGNEGSTTAYGGVPMFNLTVALKW